MNFMLKYLLVIVLEYLLNGRRRHSVNGSPMYPLRQVQVGTCARTAHCALMPQVPGHGSRHLLRWHALFDGQSELTTHSGRHATYGSPKYSGMHWQAAARLRSLHRALDPHGEGLHGLIASTLGGTEKNPHENILIRTLYTLLYASCSI